jgi:hypothetical protein
MRLQLKWEIPGVVRITALTDNGMLIADVATYPS